MVCQTGACHAVVCQTVACHEVVSQAVACHVMFSQTVACHVVACHEVVFSGTGLPGNGLAGICFSFLRQSVVFYTIAVL